MIKRYKPKFFVIFDDHTFQKVKKETTPVKEDLKELVEPNEVEENLDDKQDDAEEKKS